MRLSIFGLGYVGCVTAACLAQLGHEVIGVDIQPFKVDKLNAGEAPLIEPQLDDLVRSGIASGRLCATLEVEEAISRSEMALICVGTPNRHNGGIDLTYLERVVRQIGKALHDSDHFHTVVVRSTCLPGTTETWVGPLLQQYSGRATGETLGLAVNPEFLREGSAVQDFFHPPFILIGSNDVQAHRAVSELYCSLDAEQIATDLRTAEAVKYASNAFHAVKVVFANEIGNWCKSQGLDGRQVMEIFRRDRALNISSRYLEPGFAFGGSCLGKDLRALLYQSRHSDLELPLLSAVQPSNELQIRRGLEMILATGKQRIGILGLSFKPNTDDLRASPMISLAETLLGKGYGVSIHDPQMSLARVFGANRAYLEEHIPHIGSLLSLSVKEVIDRAEVIVVGQRAEEYSGLGSLLRSEQILLDLVGLWQGEQVGDFPFQYRGIAW